jgi:DNA-binding response OmpR family regulator
VAYPKKVLIAEDEEAIRSVMAEVLAEWGSVILQTGDGIEALSLAQAQKPDLILLDYGLPGMEGLQVAAKIRENVLLSNTAIIMVTAEPEPTPTPRNTLNKPYDGWIVKPFEIEAFCRRVLEVFRSKVTAR